MALRKRAKRLGILTAESQVNLCQNNAVADDSDNDYISVPANQDFDYAIADYIEDL